jgi:hypothetical protein
LFQRDPINRSNYALGRQDTGRWTPGDSSRPDKFGNRVAIFFRQERAADKSKTAQGDPIYGNFERLAKEYLENEGQSCKDLDSAPAAAQKKKSR